MNSKDDVPIRRSDRASSEPDLLEQLQTLRKPISGDDTIAKLINPMVREGKLYNKLENDAVHCYSCGHNCKIKIGKRGICQVRYNLDGKLYVPWGYVSGLQCDPTEKKPYYHVYPGSDTLTFGMHGCDLHCSYCQNWDISQTLRDANAGRPPEKVTPEQLVEFGKRNVAKCFASSYNEPLITSEWAMAVFELAKAAGFTCLYVSNGNATYEVLEYIRPLTEGFKVDLKSMRDKSYRSLGAVLDTVLNGIRMAHDMGFWIEIVTLVVPGFNDSKEELRDAAQFIRSVSPDIPWHVTAFHKDYKMQEPENTTAQNLIEIAEMGYAEGLHYVYAGNAAGRVGRYENTYCHSCEELLIERIGYVIQSYNITSDGQCPKCSQSIPGIWPENVDDVRLGNLSDLFFRIPRVVR